MLYAASLFFVYMTGIPLGAAVLEAYGFPKDATESDIVARLFKMYQELTQ